MIIFLYGDDSFRSARKVAEIKNKFLLSDKSASGLSVFDCEEAASSADKNIARNIISVLGTRNLLSPKRLIIIKKALESLNEKDRENLLEYLKKNISKIEKDKDLVAVFWEGDYPKKSGAFFKFLEKNSKKQNFEKLSGIKLSQWALKLMTQIDPKAKISKLALEKLLAYCQENVFLLYNEIQKLINYADSKMISEKDVELLVKANLSGNIFAMVDALGARNKKEALALLHEHLEKGDDPFYLLSMFLYQFRNLLKIADLGERGAASEYEISKITKMHPFVIRKSLSQIRSFDFSRLKEIYKKLGEIDAKAKTGKIEIKLALDKFVGEI